LAGSSPGSRQVERGVRSVDKFSVLVDIAQLLKTSFETLVGARMGYVPNGDAPVDGIDAVATALTAYLGLARGADQFDYPPRRC
jgi:hypothetical protein